MNKRTAKKNYPIDQCRLYTTKSPADLAARLNTTVAVLEELAKDQSNYKIFEIGEQKKRKIEEPKPKLQRLHAHIHGLLSRVSTPDYLHSGIKGRSYLSNAKAHIGTGALIKIDVKKFFPSVPRSAIYDFFFRHLRCAGDVAGLLANILTIDKHLPTGSSASTLISYYAFKDMYDKIQRLADEHNLTVTSYVDDITISGTGATRKLMYEVRRIIGQYGLKTHKAKYFAARRPKVVTGVVVANGEVRLPNRRHLLIKQDYGKFLAAQTSDEKLSVLAVLISRVHEAAQIDSTKWLPKAKELQFIRRRLFREKSLPTEKQAVCEKVAL